MNHVSPYRRPRSSRLMIEALENRNLLSAYTVSSLADAGQGSGLTGDLRYCLTKATSGQDTVGFSVTGTIDLSRPLPTLSANLTITGPGPDASSLTVERNSSGAFDVFTVDAGATVQISGLTIAKGSADQGGGVFNKGNLTLGDCVVSHNVTLTNGNNGQGGGVYNSGTLIVSRTSFSGNTSSLTFGGGEGGAIYNHGTCNITNSMFTGNSADSQGGAIFSDKGLSISGSQFDGNTTTSRSFFSDGGAIYDGGSLTLSGSSFTNSSANQGGGLFVSYDSTANVVTSTFLSNSGGGLVNNGSMTVTDSAISKNTGGGISNESGATLTITDSTLSGNTTTSSGGGIQNGGTLAMTDSTLSDNSAHDGGGIYNRTGFFGSATIVGSTLAFNSATGNGGGIDLGTTAQIRNTILAHNMASKGPDLFDAFSSLGHNLIQNPGQGSGFGSTDALSVDPLLSPLQDNGGPTFPHALRPGSPAIGAGDPMNAPATDQRGFPRIVNGLIDIGAFEVQSAAVSQLLLIAPSSITAGAPFNTTVTAVDDNGNAVTGYTGTVAFSSSDPYPGVLPHDYAFTTSDNGKHTFAGVTLFTSGAQTLTVKDKANSSLAASATVVVSVASANHFVLTASSTAVAGTSFNVKVAAVDPYGNPATGYSGTVLFTSSDRSPQPPSDYTFTQSDNGTHIFAANLFTAGTQTLLVRDAVNGSNTGTATVAVQAAPADHFLVTAPPTAVSGVPFDAIVTALDPYGNTDTNYQGALAFTTSDPDPGVVLPVVLSSVYTFTTGIGGDNGVHDFLAGATLITPGDQTVTATDTISGITGSTTVTVNSPVPPPGGSAANKPLNPTVTMESVLAWRSQQVVLVDRLFASVNGKEPGFLLARHQDDGSVRERFDTILDPVV